MTSHLRVQLEPAPRAARTASTAAIAALCWTPLLIEHVTGDGVSHRLRDKGTLGQLREYVVHRSIGAAGQR